MRDPWFAEEQQTSLARFEAPDPWGWGVGGALDFGLSRANSSVAVASITFGDPRWMAGNRWARPMRVELGSATGTATERFAVEVPWLVDERALQRIPRGLVLGDHRGTYHERPRYPVSVFRRKPGVHFTAWTLMHRPRVVADIVPTFGRALRLEILAPKKAPYVQLSGPGLPDKRNLRRFNLDLSFREPGSVDMIPYLNSWSQGCGHDPTILDRRIAELAGGARPDAGSRCLTAADLRIVISALIDLGAPFREANPPTVASDGEVMVPMDPRNWVACGYGDLLTLGAATAARRTIYKIGRRQDTRVSLQACAGILQKYVQSEFNDLARGSGAYSSAMSSERQVNTVARVELARQHTFFGPFGLEGYNGRVDLRILPEGWRNVLCPVQTPESKKVGLVRHAAMGSHGRGDNAAVDGALAGYSDVSLAASLVPFLNHDDPTRIAIGAKMFKQALVLDRPEPPLIQTGAEQLIASEFGIARAPVDGVVYAEQQGLMRVDDSPVRFGPPGLSSSGQDNSWVPLVTDGTYVERGQAIARARDVDFDFDTLGATLQVGLNALTAFLPWHGWNFEDGIVVSESFASRLSSTHIIRLSAELEQGSEEVWELISPDALAQKVPAGTPVLRLVDRSGTARDLSFPEDAFVLRNDDPRFPFEHYVERGMHEVAVRFQVDRPLEVGDKLTTRHGGKGVVTLVEADEKLPKTPSGATIEVLLNPLGVLRRLNVGTIFELNAGLAALLEANGGRPSVQLVGRRLGAAGRAQLATRLANAGAPGGRQPLHLHDGTAVGPVEGCLVGPLYLLKLDHLARSKAGGRPDGGPSPVSFQPARSAGWGLRRKLGAPQRMGEMETWALQAVGANRFLDDVLRHRGVGNAALRDRRDLASPGMRATIGHLAAAGLHVEGELSTPADYPEARQWLDLTAEPRAIMSNIVGLRLRWAGSDVAKRPAHAGLRDVHDFLEQATTDVAGPNGADLGRVAQRVVELCIAEYSGTVDLGIGTDRREDVHFFVPLNAAVAHPWSTKDSGLPNLTAVALLPVECFSTGRTPSWQRDFVRRSYIALIHANLALAKAQAWNRSLAEGEPDRPLTMQTQELVRRVHNLLGILSHGPAEGTIAGRLQGKFGLLRRNLMGSSAVRSGRAVLVGDPTQSVEQVRLPKWMLEDLGVPTDRVPTGYEDVVVLNRQPTLTPYTLIALRATSSPNEAVRIHPHLLQSLAGDFDGDTAALHRPTTERARQQIWELRRPSASLRSSAAGALLGKLDLDVAVGLSLGTENPGGRRTLESAIAQGVGLDGVAVAHRLAAPAEVAAVARAVISTTGEETMTSRRKAIDGMAAMMAHGFESVMSWGISLVDLPPYEFNRHVLSNEAAEALLADALSGSDLVRFRQAFEANAAGKAVDLVQLLVRRGDALTPNHLLAATYLRGNFLNGLPDDEYFPAAQPAVASLAAKKLVTPLAGSLTRDLVNTAHDIAIGEEECGYRGTDHTPLTCLTANPCQAGYGLDPGTGRLPPVGARVGILAGMLIGEKSTQLAMKSIHQRDGESGLAGTVSEVAGIFGVRKFMVPTTDRWRRERRSIADLLNHAASNGQDLAAALQPAVSRFEEIFEQQVSRVHAQVILRRLLEAYRVLLAAGVTDIGWKVLLSGARNAGSRLANAATEGQLALVLGIEDVEPVRAGLSPSLARMRLLLGTVGDD